MTEGAGRGRTDRAAAVALLLLAGATAWESRTFVVGFPADPIGPRALPLFAAGILAAGAVRLLLRPDPDPRWPRLRTGGRLGAAILALLVYPALLPPLGFVVATGSVVFSLSLLFGAPPLRSGAGAFLFAGGLYLLFVHLLGVPLPIGSLFLVEGGP